MTIMYLGNGQNSICGEENVNSLAFFSVTQENNLILLEKRENFINQLRRMSSEMLN
jgi:hypothetical protein